MESEVKKKSSKRNNKYNSLKNVNYKMHKWILYNSLIAPSLKYDMQGSIENGASIEFGKNFAELKYPASGKFNIN